MTQQNGDGLSVPVPESVNPFSLVASVSPVKHEERDSSSNPRGQDLAEGDQPVRIAAVVDGLRVGARQRQEKLDVAIAEFNNARGVFETESYFAPAVEEQNVELEERVQEEEGEEEELRDDDGAVVFEDGGGEFRGVRLPPGIPVPSNEMVRRHRATGHSPYRPWCRFCVEGAANAPAHRARPEAPIGNIPELHSDYAFFRDKKGDMANTATVLITKDRKSAAVCAHVVPKKGVGGGFVVKQYDRDVKKLGYHHKILIRSDGEPAIKDLLVKVAELRAPETVLENTPKGDSRSNGRAERAVQSVEKQTRVLKIATEDNLGKFSVKHRAFSWLVMHAADVLTKFCVGPDGLTAYERIKGRAYSGLMLEFGQAILYKTSAKVQGGIMEPRWAKGI